MKYPPQRTQVMKSLTSVNIGLLGFVVVNIIVFDDSFDDLADEDDCIRFDWLSEILQFNVDAAIADFEVDTVVVADDDDRDLTPVEDIFVLLHPLDLIFVVVLAM